MSVLELEPEATSVPRLEPTARSIPQFVLLGQSSHEPVEVRLPNNFTAEPAPTFVSVPELTPMNPTDDQLPPCWLSLVQ